MKDEALKLALEALESGVKTTANRISWTEYDTCLMNEAITAIKAALAQPAQEPAFKWRSVFQEMPAENSHILFCFGVHIVEGSFTKNGWASLAYGTAQPDFWAYFPPPPHHKRNQELYAMPPKREWVGLTDEEISNLWSWSMTREAELTATTQQHAFARAIEAKLKEKNT